MSRDKKCGTRTLTLPTVFEQIKVINPLFASMCTLTSLKQVFEREIERAQATEYEPWTEYLDKSKIDIVDPLKINMYRILPHDVYYLSRKVLCSTNMIFVAYNSHKELSLVITTPSMSKTRGLIYDSIKSRVGLVDLIDEVVLWHELQYAGLATFYQNKTGKLIYVEDKIRELTDEFIFDKINS